MARLQSGYFSCRECAAERVFHFLVAFLTLTLTLYLVTFSTLNFYLVVFLTLNLPTLTLYNWWHVQSGDFNSELDMDWIHPWIGLDWIGLDWIGSEVFFDKF